LKRKGFSNKIITAFVVMIIGLAFVPVIGNFIGEDFGVNEFFDSVDSFNEGTYSGTEAVESGLGDKPAIKLKPSNTSGTWVWKDTYYKPVDLQDIVSSDKGGIVVATAIPQTDNSSLSLTLETSNDGFDTVKQSKTYQLNHGTNRLEVKGLEGSSLKMTLNFERDTTSITSPEMSALGFKAYYQEALVKILPQLFVIGLVVAVVSALGLRDVSF